MQIKILLFFSAGMIISQQALADCILDTGSDPKTGEQYVLPTTLTMPDTLITIDADAPIGTEVETLYSTRQSGVVSFMECANGQHYGKSILPPLYPKGIGVKTYDTGIPGIRVTPGWSNGGSVYGNFESSSAMSFPDPTGRFDYPPGSHFRLVFTKIAARLDLTDPHTGDQVLPAGTLLYNWVSQDITSNYAQVLVIGSIRLISTPVCKLDGESLVDFGRVSYGKLTAGVSRPLDFGLSCATDYGEYKVTASVVSEARTSAGLIKVTDKSGSTDRMTIRINDSNNNFLPADGVKGETRRGVSDVPVQFNWNATLMPGSSAELPEDSDFRAIAEIMLMVN